MTARLLRRVAVIIAQRSVLPRPWTRAAEYCLVVARERAGVLSRRALAAASPAGGFASAHLATLISA